MTVKSKSLGSVVVSPTFWKYAISSTLERNAFPSELSRKAEMSVVTKPVTLIHSEIGFSSGCGLLDQVDVKLPGRSTGLPLFKFAGPAFRQ